MTLTTCPFFLSFASAPGVAASSAVAQRATVSVATVARAGAIAIFMRCFPPLCELVSV